MTRPPVNEVLASHTPRLMGIPGVVGTGLGEQEGLPCILILVAKRSAALMRELPASIEGYPVRIDVVGEVRPLSDSSESRES